MTIGSPLGALMAISLAERVERKWFITLDFVLIIICGLLYGFSSEPFYIMLFGFLTVFFLQAFPTILSSYTPEPFPTPLRSSGMGITCTASDGWRRLSGHSSSPHSMHRSV